MVRMKTFPIGGVHPNDYKISASASIAPAELPAQVAIFTGQHIGAPATPCVKKGDKVLVGDVVATAAGFVSANIHSSVSGVVKAVELTPDGGGVRRMAVVIDRQGDEWNEAIDRSDVLVRECSLSPQEIVKKIADAGIVGLGGATFPTHIKLSPPPGKRAEMLVINGVECEPYLTADHRVMLEKADEFLVGCTIVMRAIGVEKCYIGVENNKPDAIRHLTEKSKQYKGVEVVSLKVQYPQGGEKQLIAAVCGRQVPSGALPIEVGAVVQNVGTVYAVYEAVQKNKPLIERVVTVTGLALGEPSNLLVRIGTPIDTLIAACGGEPENTGKIINGGPMMGRAMANTASPVTKGTSGVLLMPSEKAGRAKPSPCISCAKCVNVCPMGLEPYLLCKISKMQLWDRLEAERVTDCIECGCCSYTCPAALPLLDYIRLGKAETMKLIRSRK
ncbi:Electron transport complex protein RnfC [Mucinivorans hirudinis]|uniref:Ion-translocating oxidoreductase complex subunit C n=1 Tax=Mucinivorans hirudinis TaxID=1433126 RepID=A0A060RDX8_9BACT|nr:Electron transport complex protein RnfC [Mucinivorans hirudinis]